MSPMTAQRYFKSSHSLLLFEIVSNLSFGEIPPMVQLLDVSPLREDIKQGLTLMQDIKEFSEDDLLITVKLNYNGEVFDWNGLKSCIRSQTCDFILLCNNGTW